MKEEFTPGPWYEVEYAGHFSIQNGPTYFDNDLLDRKECIMAEANAELAAKAPEMYAALKEASSTLILAETDLKIMRDKMHEMSLIPDPNLAPTLEALRFRIESINKLL